MGIKAEILQHIHQALLTDIEKLQKLAHDQKQDSIDPELVQKSKYETQAIEAGYLADGHAKRLAAMLVDLEKLNIFQTKISENTDQVLVGSLVKLELDSKKEWCFITPVTTIHSLEIAEKAVKIITVESPLAQALLGLQVDEETELEFREKSQEIKILEIN